MTAARVCRAPARRTVFRLYPLASPSGPLYIECSSFEVVSISQFTIFISIDLYIPTERIVASECYAVQQPPHTPARPARPTNSWKHTLLLTLGNRDMFFLIPCTNPAAIFPSIQYDLPRHTLYHPLGVAVFAVLDTCTIHTFRPKN